MHPFCLKGEQFGGSAYSSPTQTLGPGELQINRLFKENLKLYKSMPILEI